MDVCDNSKLFFKIWRNKVLRLEIYKHHTLYKENKNQIFYYLNDLKNFKHLEYVENINYQGSLEIRKGDLPINGVLESIHFGMKYKFDGEIIPEGVKLVEFSYGNTVATNFNGIPNSLKIVKDVYPIVEKDSTLQINQLESISFSNRFNFQITNKTFPKQSKLKQLSFGISWNNGNNELEVGDLPGGLEVLDMNGYLKPLSHGIIPSSVTKLKISHPEQHTLQVDSIPNSVKELQISRSNGNLIIPIGSLHGTIESLLLYSTKLTLEPLSLPVNLVKLSLYGNLVSGEIGIGILPHSLKELNVFSSNTPIAHGSLPNGLKTLVYNPNPLTDINLNDNFKSQGSLKVGFFPSSITKLAIGKVVSIDNPLTEGVIPNSVTSLTLSYNFGYPLKPNLLPNSITELQVESGSNFFKFDIGSLPNSITTLIISSVSFNQPFKVGMLNPGLKKLIFTNKSVFNKSVDIIGLFPHSLTHLEFASSNFCQPIIKPGVLPISLKTLIISSNYSKRFNLISEKALPPNLSVTYTI